MGFAELFVSAAGLQAKAKATLHGGLSGWIQSTLATVQAAGPEIRDCVYSALWAEVDSVKELVPLTQERILTELRASLATAQVRAQKCTPASTSRFCFCGGDRSSPDCSSCHGTGFIPRSQPMADIRTEYDRQSYTFPRPSPKFHEWILEEGGQKRFEKRCWEWEWSSPSGVDTRKEDMCDVNTWMVAAQLLMDDDTIRVHYPGDYYKVLNGGGGGYADWCRLPPSWDMCNRIFESWHLRHTPGFYVVEDTLRDFVKPRFGECSLPIVSIRERHTREWSGRVPMGDFTHYSYCLECLPNSMEEFLDVFYDCAAQFNGDIELILNENSKPIEAIGSFGRLQCIFQDACEAVDESAIYADLVLKQAFVQPILRAYPERDEIEDQLDHLENKQGGEIMTTPSFIKILKDKRKEVRGKEFIDGAEGRLVRASELELSKKDIFLTTSLMDRIHKMGIVRRYIGPDPKLTKVCVDLTNKEEVIKFPAKELRTTSEGVLSAQTFTVLQRPKYECLYKLAEAGWKEAKSVCLNLHIRSYLPVHIPVYAFCVIMWGHSSSAEQASLSGAYVYLGDQEASVLQLPLLCNYIGTQLEDFEAYQRSLVLSTVFYGTTGFSAGQNMFGITAVEFTEYLPTSYGGITHERDSWNQMLRNHQGMEKQRFISGFNVVDFVEAGKEKQLTFPDFDLQPVPKSQPIVRTFGEQGPQLNRSQSLRVKTFSSFRAAEIPIGRRVDNTKQAIQYERARASTSEAAPRLDECNLRASGDFAFGLTLELPATLAQGTIISVFNIFDEIQTAGTRVTNEWLQDGFVSQNLTMVSHLATNQFSGVALWYIFDAYGKIPEDITTTMESEVALGFGPHLHILRDQSTSVWLVDFHKMCGQTLNFSGSGYCKPKIWIVSAATAQLARSTAVKFRVEFFTTGERLVRGLVENPLSYPIVHKHLEDINLVLPPRQFALGVYSMYAIPLALATRMESPTKRIVYSYAAGILSHFLGIGGKIRFRIETMSSAFVTCKLRVVLWHGEPQVNQMAQMPHADVHINEEAILQIQSPFYSTANFGNSGGSFYIATLCAPMAPEALESKFEFSMRILGVEVDIPLCREINYKQNFGWFMLKSKSDSAVVPLDKIIPSRVVNITSKELDVTNFVNAFAIMCATTGLHHGNCILHFSWSWHQTEAAKHTGRFQIETGMGRDSVLEHIGSVNVFNYPQSTFQLPFCFGSFAGPVPSRGELDPAENWFRIKSPNFTWITTFYVSIEVLDGFKFYGRSAGPITTSKS